MKVYLVFEDSLVARFVDVFATREAAQRFALGIYGDLDYPLIYEYEVRN